MKKFMPWMYITLMFLWMGKFMYTLFTTGDRLELIYCMAWVITAVLFIDTNSREEDHEEMMAAIERNRTEQNELYNLANMKMTRKIGEISK